VKICAANPKIDGILMDIKMPVMDGIEAAKQIQKTRPNIPIIALSAYALEHEVEKYNDLGFHGYITKPIDKRILISMIDRFK
ncbi:MAG: response regulator, partial [Salinivirgaceae bacterium]|nr:response regulator [Salinivirgaceae bacterium]